MASALEEREEQSSKCFICNVKVTTRSSYDIYCTFMPQREVLLMDVMSKILKKIFNPSEMRSSILCRRCFTLFDELDQISTRFKKLQTDIIKRYSSTCIEYKDDKFLSIVNSMTPTKIIELPLSEKENESIKNNEEENGEKSSDALSEIVEKIISNIQAEETMDSVKDLKESTPDSPKEKKVFDEVVTEHIDDDTENIIETPQVIMLPNIVKQSVCETKLVRHSVGEEGEQVETDVSYSCEHCDDSFKQASDLKSHHATVHQTQKRFICSSCDKSYSTKQSLNNHLIKEHKSLDEQVDSDNSHCGTDSNMEEVGADFTNDSSEGVIIDVKPDFPIDNSMYLEEVLQEDSRDDEDDFEWKEERYNYSEDNVEDSSSAVDETITPSSGSEKSGKRHINKGRKKRGSSRSDERACLPAIHTCGLCGKKWRTTTELKSHIQSHSSIRPYVCEICGQAYKMKKALDVHIGMHNGIHPFTCEYCHKSFTQKVGLQKHIPIHTGYTRFQCDLCGKRFIHQKSFHIHTMTHTGEKHVKCPECGLAVLSQSHLKRHLRVHTGERPYACPICGKRFAEKYNMNAHVHIHDNNPGSGPRRNRNHICQLCGMSYDRKHKLEYHLASTHNKIDNKSEDLESTPQLQPKNEYFQENSQGQQIITVDDSAIDQYDSKLKLEYHLTPAQHQMDSSHLQDQETEQQQPKTEYFQENSQGHQIITVDNGAIEHNGRTAMITVSGVKVPISLSSAPIMVTTLPQQSQTTNLVPINIPAGSIIAYTPTSSNNGQSVVDGTPNTYMPQNPVTIQLS